MSKQELDQGDEELFGVVNGHAKPEATQQAEEIARRAEEAAEAKAAAEAEARKRELVAEKEAKVKEYRRKITRAMIVKLIVLIFAAALFLAALLLPAWVPVLCFGGLAVCLIVGAVVIDRFILSRR